MLVHVCRRRCDESHILHMYVTAAVEAVPCGGAETLLRIGSCGRARRGLFAFAVHEHRPLRVLLPRWIPALQKH
jgi:hypothetical protein